MKIFNLAEELENERKKNKTLEYKIQELNTVIEYQKNQLKEYKDIKEKLVHAETTAYNKNKIISKMQKNIINKAIDILEKRINEIKNQEWKSYTGQTDEEYLEEQEELLNILKGDNK